MDKFCGKIEKVLELPNKGLIMARGEGGQDKGKLKGKPKLTTKEKKDKKKEKAKTKKDYN